jgi:diguanylate cyclase (GGDEF)-like protein
VNSAKRTAPWRAPSRRCNPQRPSAFCITKPGMKFRSASALCLHNPHGSMIGAVETFEESQPAASPDHREYTLKLSSCIDNGTGVTNMALMRSHLRQTLATFVEVEVPFGVLCLRLEGLQHFRASLGAEAASSLRVGARSLESTLWTTDHIGRWSDEQFLMILNGCRAETLHSVSERVRRMLARDGIEWWGERRSLPVSIGEAAHNPRIRSIL